MPVPETKAASASQAARRLAAARACSRIEKAVIAASRQMIPGDDDQPEIMLLGDAGVDAQHGVSIRSQKRGAPEPSA